MIGVIYNQERLYRLATSKPERDVDNRLGLDESVVPGGDYLRLDADRPFLEFYRREGRSTALSPSGEQAPCHLTAAGGGRPLGRGQRVGGRPNAGNSAGPNVVISAMTPARMRRTSSLNARYAESPGRRR